MNRNFLFLSALTSLFNLLYAGNAQSAAADVEHYNAYDHDHDHDHDRAVANSLINQREESDQEDADLQEAIRRSNAESSLRPALDETAATAKAYQKIERSPFLQHVASLVRVSDFKDGNYRGTNKEIKKLFQEPDYQTWQQAFLTYGIERGKKPTGLEIVYFLQTLQESQLNREISALVNHALLEIISGCWGFTKDPVDPAVITRIKGILKGVAQYTTTDLTEDAFNQKVTSVAALEKFKGDSSFHSHYAEVLSCLNEGFFEGKPERVYDLLELQTAMLMSFGLDGTHYTKVFTKAGYYVDNQITVDQLVETAFHRGSSIKVNKAQVTELQKYFGSWDADSPGISSNLENLKLFQALIAAQPLANRYSVEAVKQRLLDKLDHLKDWAEDDKKVLAEILFESLKQYDFRNRKDHAYEQALFNKKNKSKGSHQGVLKVLNDGFFYWFMDLMTTIDEENKIKRGTHYVIKYAGHISTGEVRHAGEVISQAEWVWLANQPQNGITAGAEEEGIVIGIKSPLYRMLEEGPHKKENCGRLIDYLIDRGEIVPELKLSLLLALNQSNID